MRTSPARASNAMVISGQICSKEQVRNSDNKRGTVMLRLWASCLRSHAG